MLIHITPKLYLAYCNEKPYCELIDLTIEELGLVLTRQDDLVTRRPYPNKNYQVGCRKEGQKAMDGILIDTPNRVPSFTTLARWRVDADTVITHRTQYIVIDEDFDTVTDKMTMWYATGPGLGGWSSRWPACAKELVPEKAQPRMEVWSEGNGRVGSNGTVCDTVASNGQITMRTETFQIPTIERERLFGDHAKYERLPSRNSAFRVEC